MTDYGTVKMGSLTALMVHSAFDIYDFHQVHNGVCVYFGRIDLLFDLEPAPLPIPPIWGQLWPRGMVGEYIGPAHIPGTAKIFNLNQDLEPPNSIIGQLWPRGDYVPHEAN